MRVGFALAALAGVVLAALLIVHEGVDAVFRTLAPLGWLMAPVAAFHLVPQLLSAAAWRRAVAPSDRRAFATFLTLRAVREGINNLLPVAQVGGDLVGARLLAACGVPLAAAAASVVVDFTVELFTLGAFILIGLALLALGDHGASADIGALVGTACATVAAILGFAAAQRAGLLSVVDRLLDRLARKSARFQFHDVRGLEGAVRARYRNRVAVTEAAALHLASWLAGTGEIWLALRFMGTPIGLGDALVLESLTHAVRGAAFVVPGALGVQEAGLVVLGALIGIDAQTALALSLVKRAREIAFGAPAILAWQAIEARQLWRGRSRPVRAAAEVLPTLDGTVPPTRRP